MPSRSWSGEATLAGLSRLTDAIHETGATIAGQVGHAGPVANGRSNGVARTERQPDAEPAVDADDRLGRRATT